MKNIEQADSAEPVSHDAINQIDTDEGGDSSHEERYSRL
jgi:hypothetical protein